MAIDEMLTVCAIGLCMALVALAAYFHYFSALGAFIKALYWQESAEAKRIRTSHTSLKRYIWCGIFCFRRYAFRTASLDRSLAAILILSSVIIFGKLLSVSLGAFLTGQTLKNSFQTGFSMAQIGEFSFIISLHRFELRSHFSKPLSDYRCLFIINDLYHAISTSFCTALCALR